MYVIHDCCATFSEQAHKNCISNTFPLFSIPLTHGEFVKLLDPSVEISIQKQSAIQTNKEKLQFQNYHYKVIVPIIFKCLMIWFLFEYVFLMEQADGFSHALSTSLLVINTIEIIMTIFILISIGVVYNHLYHTENLYVRTILKKHWMKLIWRILQIITIVCCIIIIILMVTKGFLQESEFQDYSEFRISL